MFGYMTSKEALQAGFTHHGSYYGLPCWITNNGDGVSLTAKFQPFDFLIPVISWLEVNIRLIRFPDEEPVFQFMIGGRIDVNE